MYYRVRFCTVSSTLDWSIRHKINVFSFVSEKKPETDPFFRPTIGTEMKTSSKHMWQWSKWLPINFLRVQRASFGFSSHTFSFQCELNYVIVFFLLYQLMRIENCCNWKIILEPHIFQFNLQKCQIWCLRK